MDCADTKMMHVPYTTKCFPLTTTEQNGNVIPSPANPSPDSARSTSSLSSGSVESPPDVDMFECLSDVNSVEGDPPCTSPKSSPRGPTLLPPLVKVNRSSTINIQDPNMALVITDLHNGSYIQQSDNTRCGGSSVDGGSRAPSPLLSSARTGTQGSSSLPSCCSSSDGSVDWVLRSNSFCLQDSDQPLSFSYLTESAGSPAAPSDLGVPCDALQVRDPGGTPKEDGKHLHLGNDLLSPNNQTYFLDECTRPSSFSVPPLAVPPSKFATPETCRTGRPAVNLLHSSTRASGQFVTAGDKTFVVSASADTEPSSVQTSTPVQSLSDKTFCLPTLNESPFTNEPGDQGSSKADGVKEQPRDETTKTLAKTAAVAPKVKKFTKPDFSSVKSKIFSRQASTQKSSNVQASPFCSFKRKEDQAQKQSHPTMSKFSPPGSTAPVFSPPVRPDKIALNKGEAPPSGKQEKPTASHKTLMFPKARPRLWSESSSGPKSKVDDLHQRGKTVPPSFISKVYKAVTHSKAVPQKLQVQFQQGECKGSASSREGALCRKAAVESRSECPKISPKTVCTPKPVASATGTPAAAGAGVLAGSEGRKGRFGAQPLPCRERAAPGSPAALSGTSREPPSMARLRQASNRSLSPSRDSQAASHSRNAPSKVSAGIGLARSLDATSGVKHGPKRILPPVTPSRIPVQPQVEAKIITRSLQTSSQNTQGYGESCNAGGKAATSKASGLRPRLQTPAKTTTTIAVYRSSTASNPPTIKPVPSTAKKLPTRPARTNAAQPVDKSKQRPSARSQQQQQQSVNGHREPRTPVSEAWSVERYQAQCERGAKTIRDLKGLLLGSNRRFEAVSVVLQHCIAEHEESLRKCGELSAELVNLREELVNSSQSCERIQQEKEELRVAFDGTLQKLQEQHRNDLAELEERLRTFYSAEWEKVHQVYQEEADKCKTQMEQQLESLRSKYEVLRKDLEASHADKMESIKQQYEKSFEELKKAHEAEMQTLDKTLAETENNLTGQIEDLKMENSALNEKLKAAEDGRMKDMAAESPKDSHTLYLEQELESLKVVLDIKNKQLHQQDKKLMQLDKVLEKNLKLDECLQKSQQENEDLKARMDKHVTLSRQLSSKQAVLQDSLQKESNVNKRLSMEIEELLWKLQNGDLTSPRKLSPSAPSAPSMPLPSPQNSAIFSSTPVAPR